MVDGANDDASFATDRHGTSVPWHGGVDRVFGYATAAGVGQPAAILVTPDDRAAAADQPQLQQAAQQGRGEDAWG
jgi:hypothetical protein